MSSGFSTRSDTNQAIKPHKTVRGLKFLIQEEVLYYICSKTKALIRCAVTAQLICAFVFEYAKSKFSHDTAQSGS